MRWFEVRAFLLLAGVAVRCAVRTERRARLLLSWLLSKSKRFESCQLGVWERSRSSSASWCKILSAPCWIVLYRRQTAEALHSTQIPTLLPPSLLCLPPSPSDQNKPSCVVGRQLLTRIIAGAKTYFSKGHWWVSLTIFAQFWLNKEQNTLSEFSFYFYRFILTSQPVDVITQDRSHNHDSVEDVFGLPQVLLFFLFE